LFINYIELQALNKKPPIYFKNDPLSLLGFALGIEMEILFATPWFVSSRNRRWGKKIAMNSPPERPKNCINEFLSTSGSSEFYLTACLRHRNSSKQTMLSPQYDLREQSPNNANLQNCGGYHPSSNNSSI